MIKVQKDVTVVISGVDVRVLLNVCMLAQIHMGDWSAPSGLSLSELHYIRSFINDIHLNT